MNTPSKTATPGLDNLARVLHADPKFLRARLKEARARIVQLEAQNAEQAQTIGDLLDRLSEARRKAAEA